MKKHIRSIITTLILLMGVVTTTGIKAQQWSVNPNDYHYDMRLYLDCVVGSGITDYSGYTFGAFVGNECRGVGEILSGVSETVFYMVVYSNESSGENITFKAYDSATGATYSSVGTLEFKSEEKYGAPSSPYKVNFQVDATEVKLSSQSVSLLINETTTLTATVAPTFATDKSVIWSSSAPAIATVANGTVTALSKGTTTITATTANGKTATCTVTVNAPEPTGVTLSQSSASLVIGGSLNLSATLAPTNAESTLTWKSSDEKVATVANGTVTAIAKGTATITVSTANGKSATCTVTVNAPEPTGVTLSQTSASLVIGGSLTLSATLAPANAESTLIWKSSDEKVATVANGTVTAIAKGTATITVSTANGKSATCTVTVNAPEPTGVTLSKTSASLLIGETVTLTATLAPTNAESTLTWKSSDEKVATVANGTVKAVAKGTATITVSTANGKSATCTVTVTTPEPTGVTLNKTNASLVIGETVTLTATLAPANAESALTWKSSNEKVATVANGTVTAIAKGTATITVSTANGKTATCTVTVNAPEPTSVTLNKASAALLIGETMTLTATLVPANAESALTWKSSDEKVATVTNGTVTAVAKGTATITVSTANGKSATCMITVSEKVVEVTGVTLNEVELTLEIGETFTLVATVSPTDATDKNVTWTSSDSKVATVENGVVKALAPGTATIKATCGNVSASCSVTVKNEEIEEPPVAENITLSESEVSLNIGESLQLIATVTPEDAETSLSWISDNTEVASVDEKGFVTALAEGVAIITVITDNELTASCEVTVLTEAGMEALFSDYDNVMVYSMGGILIKKNADKEFLNSLGKGIYIIKQGTGAFTIVK